MFLFPFYWFFQVKKKDLNGSLVCLIASGGSPQKNARLLFFKKVLLTGS
jgi:hypothetical protein